MPKASSMLLYSQTGAGKTSQLGEIAQWIWKRYGQATRLLSADSTWDPIESMVARDGWPLGKEYVEFPGGPIRHVCIEAWNLGVLNALTDASNAPYDPRPVIAKLADGFWPVFTAPTTRSISHLAMQPPRKENGLILSANSPCVPLGCVCIEGLHTLCNLLLQNHIRKARIVGEDVVGKWESQVPILDPNGTETVFNWVSAKAGRAHFGQVQDEILLGWIPRFSSLPVKLIVWTSHETRGTDEKTGIKQSQLGPATIGVAAVGRTAQNFGDTFHLVKTIGAAVPPKPAELEFRAYYEDHADDKLGPKFLWPAKLSVAMARVGELHKAFPGGFVRLTPEKTMTQYLDWKWKEEVGR